MRLDIGRRPTMPATTTRSLRTLSVPAALRRQTLADVERELAADGITLPLHVPDPPAGKSRITKGQQEVLAYERDRAALGLRRAGLTFAQIGVRLACSDSMASRIVKRALRRQAARGDESAEMVMRLELDRLDMMLAVLMPLIEAPVKRPEVMFAAIDRVLKIMVRRAKYLGLDGRPASADPNPTQVARKAILPRISGATLGELTEFRAILSRISARQEAAIQADQDAVK
jgi:hypothetical protein